MKVAAISLSVSCLFCGGCTVGEDYQKPDIAVPSSWKSWGAELDEKELRTWWRTFADPKLTSLVRRATEKSLDLELAAARLREARALRGVAQSGRFPTLRTLGSVDRGRSQFTGRVPANVLYSGNFDAGWEADLFGKIRRRVEAAEAQLQASEEDYYDVLVTLTAEVALNYVELRSFQARLEVAEANRDLQRRTLELVRDSFSAGEVSRLDLEQAQGSLASTKSQIPLLDASLARARHRLAVALGQAPTSLDDELDEPASIPTGPPSIAVGVPADVIRRRPDVRRAERLLAAQWARVGEATADLYPAFRLNGTIGLESIGSGDFLKGSSRLFGVGPSVQWDLFSGGRIRQAIEVEIARQEQAVIRYEAAVLGALRDVEDAIVNYGNEMVRRGALLEAERAARRTMELAREQYREGEQNFLIVLDAQRELFRTEDERVQSEALISTHLIRLYKALGGGWSPSQF